MAAQARDPLVPDPLVGDPLIVDPVMAAITARLDAAVKRRHGNAARIANVQAATLGASNRTLLFDLVEPGGDAAAGVASGDLSFADIAVFAAGGAVPYSSGSPSPRPAGAGAGVRTGAGR